MGSLQLAWTFTAGAPVGDPIVQGGTIFVAADNRRLYALDLENGSERWRAIAGSVFGFLTPLAADDVLLRLSGRHVLRRYDPRSGRIFWRRDVPVGVEGSPAEQAVDAGTWFFSTGMTLVAYEIRRGTMRWSRPLGCFHCGVAAVGGRVYAAGGRRVLAMDGLTGRTTWSAEAGATTSTGSWPVVAGDQVIVRTKGGREGGWTFSLEAFGLADGRRHWRTPVGVSRFFTFTPPATDGSIVVHASTDGRLYCLDARSGAVRWTSRIGLTSSIPALANGVVYVVDGSDRLRALDAESGTTLWTSPERLEPRPNVYQTPSPVVAGGHVLVGTNDGRLLAYRAASKG